MSPSSKEDSALPTGKIHRAFTGCSTAAKVGVNTIAYQAKRPFLSRDRQLQAKEETIKDNARTVFEGLCLLKGTALKIAQLLSLELDIIPEAACRELSKAYHQVPPINKALVRRAVTSGLGQPPEELFSSFTPEAFAAASIGQVHSAVTFDQEKVAVKIQYPGIDKTISNDISLLKNVLWPILNKEQLAGIVDEIAARLYEEVDYIKEAENVTFFSDTFQIDGIRIPEIFPELSCKTIITTRFMPGMTLDQWIETQPAQSARNIVAQKLQDLFITMLYDQNILHADPNPGNFIISDDLTIGLVDFGCIKKFDQSFVEKYRRLAATAYGDHRTDHLQSMVDIGIIPEKINDAILPRVKTIADNFSDWYGKLYEDEIFDFNYHKGFISEGKNVMNDLHKLRKHLDLNPDLIFLDRTRYGLLRLFEQMGAQVKFRNSSEQFA